MPIIADSPGRCRQQQRNLCIPVSQANRAPPPTSAYIPISETYFPDLKTCLFLAKRKTPCAKLPPPTPNLPVKFGLRERFENPSRVGTASPDCNLSGLQGSRTPSLTGRFLWLVLLLGRLRRPISRRGCQIAGRQLTARARELRAFPRPRIPGEAAVSALLSGGRQKTLPLCSCKSLGELQPIVTGSSIIMAGGAARRGAEGHGHGFLPRTQLSPDPAGGAGAGDLPLKTATRCHPVGHWSACPPASLLTAPVRTPVHRLRAREGD